MPQKDPPGAATYYEHQLRSVLNQILCSLRKADDLIDRTGSTFRQSGEGKKLRKRLQLARTALMAETEGLQ